MGSCIRLKTLGWETKDFITHTPEAARHQHICISHLIPPVPKEQWCWAQIPKGKELWTKGTQAFYNGHACPLLQRETLSSTVVSWRKSPDMPHLEDMQKHDHLQRIASQKPVLRPEPAICCCKASTVNKWLFYPDSYMCTQQKSLNMLSAMLKANS